jgi:hypothetical protein
MNKARSVLLLLTICAAAGAAVAILVGAAGSRASERPKHHTSTTKQRPATNGNPTANHATAADPLSTVTPYQLQQLNIALGPADFTPGVSSATADAAASQIFGEKEVNTALATCSFELNTDSTPKPCWVVEFDTPTTMTLRGPTAPRSATPTFEFVVVNAVDGSVMVGLRGSIPASPPSS